MRKAGIAAFAVVIGSLATGDARAGELDGLVDRIQAVMHTLAGDLQAADHEVLVPPPGIDREMAHVPPSPHGTMRIITPPVPRGRGS